MKEEIKLELTINEFDQLHEMLHGLHGRTKYVKVDKDLLGKLLRDHSKTIGELNDREVRTYE